MLGGSMVKSERKNIKDKVLNFCIIDVVLVFINFSSNWPKNELL
jgi:hypothetical protein